MGHRTWVAVQHLVDAVPGAEGAEGKVLPGAGQLLGGALLPGRKRCAFHCIYGLAVAEYKVVVIGSQSRAFRTGQGAAR